MSIPAIMMIEDCPAVHKPAKRFLEKNNFAVRVFECGLKAMQNIEDIAPDLILLDLGLPDVSGWEIIKELKSCESTSNIPLIIITGQNITEKDAVSGLNMGADDYITKPFSWKNLLARVNALMRRSDRKFMNKKKICAGDLEIDISNSEVYYQGSYISLKGKEFEIFCYLVCHMGKIVTREQIYENIWKYRKEYNPRSIDTYIWRLRRKLGTPLSDRIKTIYDTGYKFLKE